MFSRITNNISFMLKSPLICLYLLLLINCPVAANETESHSAIPIEEFSPLETSEQFVVDDLWETPTGIAESHFLFLGETHREIFLDEIGQSPKEKLVLFTLGTGIGDQFAEAVKMQKLPNYFLQLADARPSCSAKIFAIDPCFSLDSNAPEYAFLNDNGWTIVKKEYHKLHPDSQPPRFTKGNIEIVFFKFVIPDKYARDFAEILMNYTSTLLDHGGCVFMGHHGSAYGVWPIFTGIFNALQESHARANNLLMYVCCAETPPWSNVKVYHHVPYDSKELSTLYEMMDPWYKTWMYYPKSQEWEQLSWKEQQAILDEYLEGFTPSYQLFYDLSSLEVQVDSTLDNEINIIAPFSNSPQEQQALAG